MTAVRIGVAGLGLIGGSILKRLAELTADYEVLGYDIDAETRGAVESDGFGLADSLEALVDQAELVVVAVPPENTGDAVAAALRGNERALVTDVASVKAPIVERVAERAPGELGRFLPSHPLSGAETAGWTSARRDLLDGAVWAVCPPSDDAPADLLCRWAAVFESFDARLVVCDPLEHDMAVARTSHAPHLAAEVIAASLEHGPASLAAALSGGAFRDMTRIARSSPALWSEIVQLNRAGVAAVLDEWIAGLERLRAAVGDGSEDAVSEAWERGRSMVELVERLRWNPPAWHERSFDWPAWSELVALGRDGVAIRRVRSANGRLSAELSAQPG